MRTMWWKYLGLLIILAVVIFGLSIPLKPGITAVSNNQVTADGSEISFTVEGYNTFFTAGDNRVWLKYDDNHILEAQSIEPISDNILDVRFELPMTVPVDEGAVALTLITDNPKHGTALMPTAVLLKSSGNVGSEGWNAEVKDLNDLPGIQFPYRNILNETIRNTFFHIPLWFSMFILLGASVFYAIRYLRKANIEDDIISSSLISVGVLFGILGILTGSVWARYTWGTFWTGDVKLNMSAIAMLIYVAYLILRSAVKDVDQRGRLSAGYAVFAFVALIPLVFVIPRMTDSLHPGNGGNPALGGEDMESTLRMFFYPAIIGFTLLGLWMASLKIRYEKLELKLIDSQKKDNKI